MSRVTSKFTNFTFPTIQRFTSGSGTYTKPSGCKWIRVRMIGGGGGGNGSGTIAGTAGTAGGNTTFGTSLLTANGGNQGALTIGGTGGSATINSPAIAIVGISGSQGLAPTSNSATVGVFIPGAVGGSSPFGGAGPGGGASLQGLPALANSGSGGGGGGGNSTLSLRTGSGGGSGGYIEAIITSPSTTYAYAVGAVGNGGGAGTSGFAGGNGGSGIIIVEEYYE